MSSPATFRVRCCAALLALSTLVLGGGVGADPVSPEEVKTYTAPKPKRLEGVDIDEQLGGAVPRGLRFEDIDGKPRTLGEFFDGARPVILTFNYSDCPMLCSLQLTGLVKALKELKETAGQQFQIVTIGLDPDETQQRSADTKQRYIGQYERPGAADGWHFLRGDAASIKAAADSIGFGYNYNEARDEYLHPAAVALLSPDGRVMRYLYGIEFDPETVRLSLIESSQGRIGTTVDKVLLYCFVYDAGEGRYAPVAMNVMQVGGGITLLLLGSFLGIFWLREWRKRRASRDPGPDRLPHSVNQSQAMSGTASSGGTSS